MGKKMVGGGGEGGGADDLERYGVQPLEDV